MIVEYSFTIMLFKEDCIVRIKTKQESMRVHIDRLIDNSQRWSNIDRINQGLGSISICANEYITCKRRHHSSRSPTNKNTLTKVLQ